MRGIKKTDSIKFPESWGSISVISKILKSGICRYESLIDGTISVKDFFFILRCIDFNNFIDIKSQEKIKQQRTKNGRNR